MPDSSPDQPEQTGTPEVLDAEIVEEPSAPPAVPQHPVPQPAAPVFTPDYDERGVPSFDYVRDKIEGRAATAVGSTELAGETEQGRTLDDQMAERDRKAKEKLAEIRRSLGG